MNKIMYGYGSGDRDGEGYNPLRNSGSFNSFFGKIGNSDPSKIPNTRGVLGAIAHRISRSDRAHPTNEENWFCAVGLLGNYFGELDCSNFYGLLECTPEAYLTRELNFRARDISLNPGTDRGQVDNWINAVNEFADGVMIRVGPHYKLKLAA